MKQCNDSILSNPGHITVNIALIVCLFFTALPSASSGQAKHSRPAQNKAGVLKSRNPADVHPGDLDSTFGTSGKV
ncbi:MAG TPA: hypothetical protein VEZ90_11090, partial [Blastocatellia bacterium]|nr:hypothetical protein [Blastocatellia bacterium]